MIIVIFLQFRIILNKLADIFRVVNNIFELLSVYSGYFFILASFSEKKNMAKKNNTEEKSNGKTKSGSFLKDERFKVTLGIINIRIRNSAFYFFCFLPVYMENRSEFCMVAGFFGTRLPGR